MDPVASTDLIADYDLHWIDGLVIVFYLLGITLTGLWIGRRVSTLNDFFMPRRFGKGMMVMHAFGTGTASDQAVTVSSATFRSGLSGVWYQWLWLFVTPFYWLIAPIFRRFRAVTTADVYELRYDRSVAVLFAVIGIANMCIKIGLMLVGAGALVDAGTGGLINADLAIAAVTIMFVTYGVAGGLSAAIVTDYVQGILTIVFSFMLLPLILLQVGGIEGVRETITDDSMLSLVAPGKISLFFIMMMSFQALMGIVAQPFIMGVCAAGKTEWEGRIGIVGGNLIKRLCTAAWSITAICAVAWYIQKGNDPALMDPSTLKSRADGIYGEVAYYFLPRLMPGLLGLFLAALLAGIMSSCDSFMISSAALFTENIYKPMRSGVSEKHCIWVGQRASSSRRFWRRCLCVLGRRGGPSVGDLVHGSSDDGASFLVRALLARNDRCGGMGNDRHWLSGLVGDYSSLVHWMAASISSCQFARDDLGRRRFGCGLFALADTFLQCHRIGGGCPGESVYPAREFVQAESLLLAE